MLAVLVALAVVGATAKPFLTRRSIPLIDLRVYVEAVSTWLAGGPVYSLNYNQLDFTYPPFALVALSWVGPLGFPLASVVVTVASIACLAVVVAVLGRRLAWTGTQTLVVFGVLLWVEPVRATLRLGQVNLLLLVLVVVDCFVVTPRWRGLLTGVATAVKLTPGIFLLWFAVSGQRRAAVRLLAGAAGATLLAVPFAPGSSRRYWTQLFFQNRIGTVSYAYNQSLSGTIARLARAFDGVPALTAGADVVTLAGCGWLAWRLARGGDAVAGFAVVATLGLLVSPISWTHHFVWALPLVAVTLSAAGPLRRRTDSVAGRGVAGRGVAASGVLLTVVFIVALLQQLPRGGHEMTWTAAQQLAGNLYTFSVVLCLLTLAVAVRSMPPTRRGSAPGPAGVAREASTATTASTASPT